jgi:GNAT superfamily N-acetyltransferase
MSRYYTIRPIVLDDLDVLDVLRVIRDAGDYDIGDLRAASALFGAFKGKQLVGLGGLACYHGFWCLRLGVVARSHRGHGLQRKLIRARLNWLRKRGAKHVNVWVDPHNVHSLNNVVSEGFRFQNEPPREFHGREHLKLRKYLS